MKIKSARVTFLHASFGIFTYGNRFLLHFFQLVWVVRIFLQAHLKGFSHINIYFPYRKEVMEMCDNFKEGCLFFFCETPKGNSIDGSSIHNVFIPGKLLNQEQGRIFSVEMTLSKL